MFASDRDIESDTDYARRLRDLADTVLCFERIRNISCEEYKTKHPTVQERDQINETVQRGAAILGSTAELMAYMYAHGLRHNAALLKAFETFQGHGLFEGGLEIVDWGCGQGLGLIALNDFLRKNECTPKITRVVLIDPSEYAIKRAALHASVLFPEAKRTVISKTFGKLCSTDMPLKRAGKRLHIFSNVLDLDVLGNKEVIGLADFVNERFQGVEYAACVGPTRNVEKVDSFYRHFVDRNTSVSLIADLTDSSWCWAPGKDWTIKLKTFHFGCRPGLAEGATEEGRQRPSRAQRKSAPPACPRSKQAKPVATQHKKPRVGTSVEVEAASVPPKPCDTDSPVWPGVSRTSPSEPLWLCDEVPDPPGPFTAKHTSAPAQPPSCEIDQPRICRGAEALPSPPLPMPSPTNPAAGTALLPQRHTPTFVSKEPEMDGLSRPPQPSVQSLPNPERGKPSARPSHGGYWIAALLAGLVSLSWYLVSTGDSGKGVSVSGGSVPLTPKTAVAEVTSMRREEVIPYKEELPRLTGGIRVTAVTVDAHGHVHPVTGNASLIVEQGHEASSEARNVILPYEDGNIPIGDHRLSLRVPGYRPSQASSVKVRSGLTSDVAITLIPLPATVRFSVPVTNGLVSVYRGEERLGCSDSAYDLDPLVPHILTFKAKNWRDKRVRLLLAKPGVSYHSHIEMETVAAGLRVTVTQDKGELPTSGLISVDGGEPITVALPFVLSAVPATGQVTLSLTIDGYRVLNNGQKAILVDRSTANVEFMIERKSWLSRLLQPNSPSPVRE